MLNFIKTLFLILLVILVRSFYLDREELYLIINEHYASIIFCLLLILSIAVLYLLKNFNFSDKENKNG